MKPIQNPLHFIFFFILFLIGFPLFGEEKLFSSQEIKSITIKAVHINFTAKKQSSKFYTVKWKGDLSFETENGHLIIKGKGFNSKKLWNFESSNETPLDLEISGPSFPLKLFAFSVQGFLSKWTKPVFISSFKGHLRGLKNEGLWNLSLKEGSIHIDQHQGPINLKAFRVNKVLSSSKGHFQFHINEGQLRVKKSEGVLNFTTDKANVRLTKFIGSLKGFSQSGSFSASIKPENVDLFVGDNSLKIYLMGQGARVKAYTEKGKIYGPKYFHKKFSGKSTEVSGRMRGSEKTGKVFLKSNTGIIYIN